MGPLLPSTSSFKLAVSFALGLLVYRFLNQLVPNPFSSSGFAIPEFFQQLHKANQAIVSTQLRHHFPVAKRDLRYVQSYVWAVFNCTVISLDEETVTMSPKDSFTLPSAT